MRTGRRRTTTNQRFLAPTSPATYRCTLAQLDVLRSYICFTRAPTAPSLLCGSRPDLPMVATRNGPFVSHRIHSEAKTRPAEQHGGSYYVRTSDPANLSPAAIFNGQHNHTCTIYVPLPTPRVLLLPMYRSIELLCASTARYMLT